MKECVVVLGMHRSGTSVVTGLISLFGNSVGLDEMKPTKDNPKGYFENNRIYCLNEKILKENDSTWDDFSLEVENIPKKLYLQYVAEAKNIISEQLKYIKKLVIKDPRISVLFPIWEQALRELGITIKIVFVYRSPLEVSQSLLKRDGIPIEKGLLIWSHYLLQSELYSRQYERFAVEYDVDFSETSVFLKKMGEFSGEAVTEEILKQANDLYSPGLKHYKVVLDNISCDLPNYLLNIIQLLINKDFNNSAEFDKIRNEFRYSKKLYLYNRNDIKEVLEECQNQKELINDLEKTLTNTQKDSQKSLLEMTSAIEKNKKDLDEVNIKLREKSKELDKVRLQLREKNIELSKAESKEHHKNKRLELLESRLVVGEEVFSEVINSHKTQRFVRKSSKKSFGGKLKTILFPLFSKSHKQLLRDKDLLRSSGMFSSFYYLSRYPDIWQAGVEPLDHYCRLGWKEGRQPSALFDANGYLERYQDVKRGNVNPLVHYIKYGKDEGRELPVGDYLLQTENNKEFLQKCQLKPKTKINTKYFSGNKKFDANYPSILLVSHSASKNIYGGERSFFDMVEAASKNNLNVVVVLPREQREIIKHIKRFSNEIIVFQYGWWKRAEFIDNEVVEVFSKVIKGKNIDLVHVNTIMLREPLLAAKSLNVPSVVHIRELISGDKELISLIGEDSQDIISKVNNSSDFIIANSGATASAYNAKDKTTIIHNTVDVDLFDIDNELEEVLKVGLISSNIEKKGVFEFLEIAEKCQHLRDIQFILIGPETDEIKKIRSEIRTKSLSNIILGGYRDSSLEAISEINVVLNISKFTESFGRTVLEGMAARRPVIGYRWGALSELIEDGKTGYLVPYLDIQSIVEKLDYLNENRKLVLEMGDSGRQRAIDEFSVRAYAKKVGEFYRDALKVSKTPDLHLREIPRQKISYFLWHFPVPSETFVLNELRVLVEYGYDVLVFCKQSPYPEFSPDFNISWEKVSSPKEFAKRLKETQRTIVHSHFTYPTVTEMVWPACEMAKIHFTFIAHAQDIFRYENINRNKIGEISKSKYCKNVILPSRFHRKYVIEQGVLADKTLISPNGLDPKLYAKNRENDDIKDVKRSICAIHRFTEKKGLENLILSAPLIPNSNVDIHIYGYGELEQQYIELIEKNNIENVYIHGSVKTRDEMLEIFSRNDAFLCPSIRAEDGDMDGIPTVLMEAMAYGIPVISTDISGIPDLVTHKISGFLAQSSPQAIAEKINELYATPPKEILAITKNAKDIIFKNYNSIGLVNNLVRAWSEGCSLNIIIVSWNNLPELKEVISRIQKYTLTDYKLLICDNNSDPEVKEYLQKLESENLSVEVYFNPRNSMVGPGSNIAIEMGDAEYIIYVCGKEGFVFDYLWERPLISYMDENPDVGLGGTLSYSPTYLTGRQLQIGIKLFDQFRNKQFANENPEREFKHVQGGFFIIRRKMYDQIGGFSELVKHDYTDVEYSYYAESCGWKLGNINGVLSLYNKSRPTIFSRLDESVRAIHPPTLKQLPLLDQLINHKTFFCNICEWSSNKKFKKRGGCPQCDSQPDDRTLYRYLSESTLTYRRLPAVSIDLAKPLLKFWDKQFQGEMPSIKDFNTHIINGRTKYNKGSAKLFYYNNSNSELAQAVIIEASRILEVNGIFLIHQTGDYKSSTQINSMIEIMRSHGLEFAKEISYSSAVVRYGISQLFEFKKINEN